jgi:MoaA/NifB/PqqE/SkfB family radical SAM enzyme
MRTIFLFIKDLIWQIVPQKIGMKMNAFYFQRKKFKKLDWMLLHVSTGGKCNLNCVSCNAFASIADNYMLDIASFESDCKRLSDLGAEKILGIHFVGGEPLLHPNLMGILCITHLYFPCAKINIVTNGILLLKQKEDFWNCCKLNNVGIIISHYPIKLDIKSIKAMAKKYGINLRYFRGVLPWYKMELELNGNRNSYENYKKCPSALGCIELRDGKIAPCQLIQKIQYFNNYFQKKLELTDADRIEIYKAKSIDEILEFVAKPVPFCRYCNVKWIPVKWGTSKKEITEWVAEEEITAS